MDLLVAVHSRFLILQDPADPAFPRTVRRPSMVQQPLAGLRAAEHGERIDQRLPARSVDGEFIGLRLVPVYDERVV